MKDPLHEEKTAYEIMGVADDVTAEGLQAAVRARPPDADGAAWTRAYGLLGNQNKRAELDLLLYDDATLARLLDGQPAARALAAGPERARTAATWRGRLADAFERGALDFDAVRALGVLSFWTAERAFQDGTVEDAAWNDAFGAFALLSRRAKQLGPRFDAFAPEQLAEIVRNLLIQRLKKLKGSDGDDDASSAARTKLETNWSAELTAAGALDDLARANGESRFAGGPLFLGTIGRLERVRAWLAGLPATPRRDELARRFSSHPRVAGLAELVSRGAGGARDALLEIEAMSPAERAAAEVRGLEAEARVLFGQDRLNLGDWQAGATNLERAVALAPGRPLPPEVLKKVEEVCLSEGNAVKDDDAEKALAIWERGHALHPASKNIGAAIGNELTAKSEAALKSIWMRLQGGVVEPTEAERLVRREIEVLRRAHELGGAQAQAVFTLAHQLLARIAPQAPPPPARPPVAPTAGAAPPATPRRAPPAEAPRRFVAVAPPPPAPAPASSWVHRACSVLAAAWLGLGVLTFIALGAGYDVELLGADLFSPLDPIWSHGGSRFGLLVFACVPLLLWLTGRWLTSGEVGQRFVRSATRPTRVLGALWMVVVGILLVDETAAVFSDHVMPPNAFRALADPLGALGLMGCFALVALFALPLLLRWSVSRPS